MTDAPQPAPYEAAMPVARRWSRVAIVAFVVAIVITVVLLALKTLAAVWTFAGDQSEFASGSLAFGGLLASGIVFDLLCVVLAHVAIVQTRDGARRGRILAAVALGAGYLHVLLWANRLINATIATAGSGDVSGFIANNFWWA